MQPKVSNFAPIYCNLLVSKAVFQGRELWFLNVEGNKIGKRAASTLFEPFSIPANTKIQKSVLDYKGQLWISLQANGKQSLAIWNLLSGIVKTAIPWQSKNIEMGTTPRTNGDTGNEVVIAGIVGQTKISSLSWEFSSKTGD